MADRTTQQRDGPVAALPEPGANSEYAAIAPWLKKVKFRKRIFGGVSERDVWKKIGELNDMYKRALIAERARYDALLAEMAPQDRGDST